MDRSCDKIHCTVGKTLYPYLILFSDNTPTQASPLPCIFWKQEEVEALASELLQAGVTPLKGCMPKNLVQEDLFCGDLPPDGNALDL